MVDDIRLPQILPSVPTAGRINKLKRRDSNPNERFDRRLHEEQEKEENEDGQGREREEPRIKKLFGFDNEKNSDEGEDHGEEKKPKKLLDVVI